jgi:hypothetical protein
MRLNLLRRISEFADVPPARLLSKKRYSTQIFSFGSCPNIGGNYAEAIAHSFRF